MLGHFALGTIVGLVVIPVAVLGPEQALATHEKFVSQTLLPGMTTQPGVLSRELTDMTGTDNQSIRAIIHDAVNYGVKPLPPMPSTGTKVAHAVIALAMIVWTFRAAGRIPDERYRTLFLLSGLVIVAVAVTPVNHTHYMALAIPAVLGLVYREGEQRGEFSWRPVLILVIVLHFVSGVYPRIPFLPGYQAARDLGVTMLGTLVVWYASLRLAARGAGGTKPPIPATTNENASGSMRLPAVQVFK